MDFLDYLSEHELVLLLVVAGLLYAIASVFFHTWNVRRRTISLERSGLVSPPLADHRLMLRII